MLPLALFLYTRWMPTAAESRGPAELGLASLTGVSAAYLVLRITLLEMPLWLPGPVPGWLLIFNLPVLVSWYLWKLIVPTGLDAHANLQWSSLDLWPAVVAISLALIGLGYLVVRLGRAHPVARFSSAWFLLFLLPVMNAGSFTDVLVAERFLYLPSVGFCWLMGSLLSALVSWLPSAKPRRLWLQLATALLVLAAGFAAWERSRLWGDEVALLEDMAAKSGASALPHTLLGQAYLRREETQAAVGQFQEALRRSPGNCLSMNLISLSFLRLGVESRSAATLDRGFEMTKVAIEQCPESDVLYNTLGEYYVRQRNPEAALEQFLRALELNPKRAGYHYNVGALLLRMKRPAEARPRLEHYVRHGPDGDIKRQALTWLSEM